VYSGGDNIIVGSYDKRLLWHDLELVSTKPYRTLRYHKKAIRAVKYHQGGLPLFVSTSDDGTIQVFYGKVFSDMMENPLIVPLKILRGHKVSAQASSLAVTSSTSLPVATQATSSTKESPSAPVFRSTSSKTPEIYTAKRMGDTRLHSPVLSFGSIDNDTYATVRHEALHPAAYVWFDAH